MISVTRLKGQTIAINPDLIESIEERPDTTIRLTSGESMLVRESLSEIVRRITEYRQSIFSASGSTSTLSAAPSRPPAQGAR